ncbi:MAG: hypothetical protein IPG84_02415 [Betaproteobacteria bacterium]|nr:hypothetical protein [Betaproteobacteria bacterium]
MNATTRSSRWTIAAGSVPATSRQKTQVGHHSPPVVRRAEPAAARRPHDEHVARPHLDLERRAEVLARTVGPLDPVLAQRARRAAVDAERRDAPVVREHHRGHRLEEAHAPLAAVAAAMPARAAAAAPDRVGVQPYREAPLEHFRVGEPRVRHVRLHDARAVEVGPAPDPPEIVS